MKNALYIIFTFSFIVACKKEEEPEVVKPIECIDLVPIPFVGKWERNFEAGPGNQQTVLYSIYQDSIRYKLTGQVGQANYNLIRDTFLVEDNRFIGHTSNNVYYLVFAKSYVSDSLKIYKEIIPNFNTGMNVSVPNDTTTHNHGWGVYHRI